MSFQTSKHGVKTVMIRYLHQLQTFLESEVFTCFYFYVLFVVLCMFFSDVLFKIFLLLPCANKDMTMTTMMITI